MKLAGDITIAAPRQAVFDALRDARLFAACVDGVRDLQEVDATHYRAVMETRVAYIKFKFDVAVEVTRVEAPHAIEAKIEGTPHGIVGRLSATSLTTLAEQDEGTRVQYEIEAALTGRLGSLGQPVIRSKAKEMERHFVENLRAVFAGCAAEAAR
jgi:carbon monoxide dehydrogenase subunit G